MAGQNRFTSSVAHHGDNPLVADVWQVRLQRKIRELQTPPELPMTKMTDTDLTMIRHRAKAGNDLLMEARGDIIRLLEYIEELKSELARMADRESETAA